VLFLQTTYLRERLNVAAHVVAVSNSRQMVLSSTPLQGTDWQAALAKVGTSIAAAYEMIMVRVKLLATAESENTAAGCMSCSLS
jgi:hypothetical protein